MNKSEQQFEFDLSLATHIKNHENDKLLPLLEQHNNFDMNKMLPGGSTPLGFAAIHGNAEAVKLLIQCGADVNHKSDGGRTPPLVAARSGQVRVLDVLCQHQADLTVQDDSNWNIFDCAIIFGKNPVGVIQFLLHQGMSIETKNNKGWTPLFTAIHAKEKGAVAFLVEHGADTKAESNNRETIFTLLGRMNSKEKDEFMAIILAAKEQHKLNQIADMQNNNDLNTL